MDPNHSQADIFSHFWIISAVNPDVTKQSGFTAIMIQTGFFPFWIAFAVEPGVRKNQNRSESIRNVLEKKK